MKKLFAVLAGIIIIPAFFVSGLSLAQTNDGDVCNSVTMESVLTKGIEESPELLMAEIEGESLIVFWDKVRASGMMVGSIPIDKVYVFYSENHPDWVYVYFLRDHCIVDIRFTFKNLIEEFLKE